MHIYEGLHNRNDSHLFMDPEDFPSFFDWPGDKISLVGRGDKEKNATEYNTTGKENARKM